MPITFTIDPARLGALARIEREGECGYIHVVELADILRRIVNQSGATPEGARHYVDLIRACGFAISIAPGTHDTRIIITKPRREISIPFHGHARPVGPVSLPPILWFLKFSGRSHRADTIRLFVTVNQVMSMGDTEALHHFPYGNTYVDGHICWGNNAPIVDITDPFSIDNLFFVNTAFNADVITPHATTHGIQFTNFSAFVSAWGTQRERAAAMVREEGALVGPPPPPLPEVPVLDNVNTLATSHPNVQHLIMAL